MGKRIIKWSCDGSILKVSKHLEDPKATATIDAEFDVAAIFPEFATYSEVQQQTVVYGIKQKLSDTGANDIGDHMGKVSSARAKWDELISGKWTGERINATGAAENKRIAKEVKEVSKVVSLEGLVMKKMLYPATFTQEDEDKLQDFLAEASRQGKKTKKA